MVEERKLPEGYKITEIGIIPEDWELEYIENLCVKNGLVRGPFGGALKKEYFVKYGYKVYEQKNAIYQNDSIGSYYIDERKYNELKRFEVNPGDFIVSCSGTIGKIYQIPESAEKGVINQALLKLNIDKAKIYDKFFYYYFDWEVFQERILDNTQGGAIKNLVGMPIFRKLSIPLPPLHEQQAIAEALSDVDNLITSLEKLIDKKQKIKQGTMQELLTGRKRLPGFTGEWEVKKIGEIAEIGRGRIISYKEINSSLEHRFPVYSSQTTNNGIMGYIDTYDFEGEYITWTTDGVNAGKVFYRNGKFNCTNVCGTIKLKKDDHRFVAIMLDAVTPKYVSKNLANPKLMNDVMKQIEIKLPKLEEQQAIAQILSDIDSEIEALQKKLEKYKAIKQGMMEELLTGRTRLV